MLIWEILIVLLLILLNGYFAMSELAVVSARRARLQGMAEQGNRGARAALALTDDPGHVANANRIAFWVENRAAVDLIAARASEAGAAGMEAPAECPEISPSYYAAYFEDPSGNRLEVYFRES